MSSVLCNEFLHLCSIFKKSSGNKFDIPAGINMDASCTFGRMKPETLEYTPYTVPMTTDTCTTETRHARQRRTTRTVRGCRDARPLQNRLVTLLAPHAPASPTHSILTTNTTSFLRSFRQRPSPHRAPSPIVRHRRSCTPITLPHQNTRTNLQRRLLKAPPLLPTCNYVEV